MKLLKKVSLTCVFIALIFFARSSWGSALFYIADQFSAVLMYPVLRIVNIVGSPLAYISSWWKTTAMLENEITLLQRDLVQVRAENIYYKAAQQHWDDIEELVLFKKRYHGEGFISRILMKHITNNEHSLLVDGGSYHGIAPDMVAVYKNILVGKVSEVYPFYSKIYLITDHRCSVPARCSNTKTFGLHQGANTTETTNLKFVSHLEKMEIGDTLLSSGQGLIFPSGLGLGKITNFSKDELGVHWVIEVEPFFDVQQIESLILKKRS